MNDDEIAEGIRRAIARRRGYADGRTWPPDRSLEEYGIASDFLEAATDEPGGPFSDLKPRSRRQDPPDCEAIDAHGNRIAIEVTELVDRRAIKRARVVPSNAYTEWTASKLITALQEHIDAKDIGDRLKGGPYHEYIVLIHTAEPALESGSVSHLLGDHAFSRPRSISRAYLSLDYEPRIGRYPLVRLRW